MNRAIERIPMATHSMNSVCSPYAIWKVELAKQTFFSCSTVQVIYQSIYVMTIIMETIFIDVEGYQDHLWTFYIQYIYPGLCTYKMHVHPSK